jgi:hypothetical protein
VVLRFDDSTVERSGAVASFHGSPPDGSGAVVCFANLDPSDRQDQSFDDLVGAHQNRLRYAEAERLGSLKIDRHLEFGGHLNRKLSRLFATENATDIGRRAAKYVLEVGSIRKQATVFSWNNRIRDYWYFVSGCQQNDLRSMDLHKAIRLDHQAIIRITRKRGHNRFYFSVIMNGGRDRFYFRQSGSSLEGRKIIGTATWRRVGIEHHRDPLDSGLDLGEQLQPLAADCRFYVDETGNIPTGAR